jgi:predicted Zn-dependent protease
LTDALSNHPNDPGLRETQGDLLLQEGHPNEAVRVYRQLMAADPRRVSTRISLAKSSTSNRRALTR